MMVAVKALQNAGSLEKRGIQAISETGSNIDLNNRTRGQLSLDLGENKTQKVRFAWCFLNYFIQSYADIDFVESEKGVCLGNFSLRIPWYERVYANDPDFFCIKKSPD